MQAFSKNLHYVNKNTVNEVSVSSATPDWCTVLRCEIHLELGCYCNVFALACHPKPACHFVSAMHDQFFALCVDVVTNCERSICLVLCQGKLKPGRMAVNCAVVDYKLTFGLSVVKMKGCCHRFQMAKLHSPHLEILLKVCSCLGLRFFNDN